MSKKHRDLLIRQYPHPPFPSFAWVMTLQANPPSQAYAYGYRRNAHLHARPRPRPPAHHSICPPVRRSHSPGLHKYPPPRPNSSTRPSQSQTRARTATIKSAERSNETFMETVDYRCHDPPSRPCVPWLEGYTLPGRGRGVASTQQQRVPHEDSSEDSELVRGRFAGTNSASTCSSDEPRSKKKKRMRTRAGTSIDVAKINRLDIVLGALRRACGLSAKEGPYKPSS